MKSFNSWTNLQKTKFNREWNKEGTEFINKIKKTKKLMKEGFQMQKM